MKKIYINESQISKDLLLPKFIFDAVRSHETSLGDNPAFPGEDDYPFDYTVLKERLRDLHTQMKDVGIPLGNTEELVSHLSILVRKCKELEKPIKDSLEKLCENAVNRLFAFPEGAINFKCRLVDKVEYNVDIGITPEDSHNRKFKFKDISDFELSKGAVAKRRLINSLIIGAAEYYTNMKTLYLEELNKLNTQLLELYDQIMVLNSYLAFVTKEKIDDFHPMQGSFVEVHVGFNGKKSTIEAQGVIFPLMLHDAIKGFFELFSVYGLPSDTDKAKYIVSKADFLLAEPWDMRFGVKLWSMIFDRMELGDDTNIIPYIFMELVQLPTEEFNLVMKELFMGTEKADEIMKRFIEKSKYNDGYQKFKNRVNARNMGRSVIADSYFTASELDGYDIDGEIDSDVISEDLAELDHTTYQSASEKAFDRENDKRVRDFRKQAELGFVNDRNYRVSPTMNYNYEEEWITLNNGKKLVILDDEYHSLDDLINGVKSGKLLIHARGMTGEISDDMRYIEPCFDKTMMEFYGGDYDEIAKSKSEYYGEEIEPEYPELIFASDDFTWCNDTRNGVFFIKSDGFQKSLGDGIIQLPNGRICKYWEGDVYDYDKEYFRDEPWGVEYGDWYSSSYAEVVAVMNINRGNQE